MSTMKPLNSNDPKALNIKKKNDLSSIFLNQAQNGELDLSNKSKYYKNNYYRLF